MLHKINSQGQATLAVLVFSGMIAILALVWSTMNNNQMRNFKFLEQKSYQQDLRSALQSQLVESNSCNCFFAAGTVSVNLTLGTAAQSQPISSIRLNECLPTSPPLVEPGQFVGNMQVQRIELAELVNTGGLSMSGEWRVHLISNAGLIPMTVKVPVNLMLDPVSASATPTSARIAACVAPATGGKSIGSCAPGWSMVGPAGAVGTFCIDSNERAARTQNQAVLDCSAIATQPTSLGAAHVCNHNEWLAACQLATDMNGKTDNSEWNTEIAGSINRVVASGQGSCQMTEARDRNSPTTYRCCYP